MIKRCFRVKCTARVELNARTSIELSALGNIVGTPIWQLNDSETWKKCKTAWLSALFLYSFVACETAMNCSTGCIISVLFYWNYIISLGIFSHGDRTSHQVAFVFPPSNSLLQSLFLCLQPMMKSFGQDKLLLASL